VLRDSVPARLRLSLCTSGCFACPPNHPINRNGDPAAIFDQSGPIRPRRRLRLTRATSARSLAFSQLTPLGSRARFRLPPRARLLRRALASEHRRISRFARNTDVALGQSPPTSSLMAREQGAPATAGFDPRPVISVPLGGRPPGTSHAPRACRELRCRVAHMVAPFLVKPQSSDKRGAGHEVTSILPSSKREAAHCIDRSADQSVENRYRARCRDTGFIVPREAKDAEGAALGRF